MPRFRVLLPILAILLAFATLGAGTASAKTAKSEHASKAQKAAAGKCWQRLLNDWYPDGKINGTYPVACYREAIAHLPEDLKAYGEARNDITRALLAFLASGNDGGAPPGPNTPVPGTDSGSSSRDLQSHQDKGFLQTVADALGPGNATSIPLPLLILAGLGLLLVAAAGASFAARRIQARRLRPVTSPGPSPDRRK
jgi:hypothetical protein